jgi:dTDP-glucose 4,6-dehydratase
MKVIITGGSGFIGSFAVKKFLEEKHQVLNIDKLTYAGSNKRLFSIKNNPNYKFLKKDILDKSISKFIFKFKPDVIINFAAETHVDNSIKNPYSFIYTNFNGVYNLLNASTDYVFKYKKKNFFFFQISTDEVFGSAKISSFDENSPYLPSSPYSATKASADFLVRSWNKTYNLPYIISYCTNNYGPHQDSEKFIPKIILNCINKKKIPLYGKGNNVRDWTYVKDNVDAIYKICIKGKKNSRYFISSQNEKTNIQVIRETLKEVKGLKFYNVNSLIKNVTDRKGHDFRYSLRTSKNLKKLKWKATTSFAKGIKETVDWYVSNKKFFYK